MAALTAGVSLVIPSPVAPKVRTLNTLAAGDVAAEADPVQPADTSASAARAAAVLATRIPAMGILLRRRSESIVTLWPGKDRKSTRLNSSHLVISYAVFC